MISIQFPEPEFRTKRKNNADFIFDAIRKKWLLLTEEEWVRQNFVHFLKKKLLYPSSLIAVEKEIVLNDLKKRFDILVYNSSHQPWMLVECKAPAIRLTDDVLQQALRYNISVPVRHIVISNGITTLGWTKEQGTLSQLHDMPRWNDAI